MAKKQSFPRELFGARVITRMNLMILARPALFPSRIYEVDAFFLTVLVGVISNTLAGGRMISGGSSERSWAWRAER